MHKHGSKLILLMLTAAQNGIIFNSKKCNIKQHQVSFFWCIFSADGIVANPQKVQSIREISPTKNVKELQSFFSLLKLIQPLISRLSHHTLQLCKALVKGKTFYWDEVKTHPSNN